MNTETECCPDCMYNNCMCAYIIRRREVEAILTGLGRETVKIDLCESRELARTLADEVDAERAIVTKLLDLIAPHMDEFGNRQWWHYKHPQQIYNSALEIAGRKE